MSKKTTPNKEADNLFEKILENTISLVLSFVFSIGLISGASYILFDSQKDFLEFQKYETVFTSEINSANVQCQICEINKNGWFSQPDKQAHTFELIQKLKDQKAEKVLPSSLADEVQIWCVNSLMQLSSEQGRINGYLPNDELILKYQKEILTTYEYQISVFNEMKSMVLYWDSETTLQRETRIENIDGAILNITSSLQSLLSINEQILAEYDQKQIELKQQFDEFDRQYRALQTKRFLAIVGILVGVTTFLAVSISAYKKYFLKSGVTPKKDRSLKR